MDFSGRFGMERHAEQCFVCGKTLADAQKLSRMARSLGRVKAPPEFESILLARIQREGLRPRRALFRLHPVFWGDWWHWRPISFAAAALAILVAGAVLSTHRFEMQRDGSVRWARKDAGSRLRQPNSDVASGTIPLEPTDPPDVGDGRLQVSAPAVNSFTPEGSGISIGTGSDTRDGYVEYLVPGADGRQIVMRLPKTIWMRYGQPSEEYYIRNVSH